MPECPEHKGDTTRQVRRAGTYGLPPRQLFECRITAPWKYPDGKRRRQPGTHRFTATLPQLLRAPTTCPHCDSRLARHQGLALSRKYEFHLQLVAQARADVRSGRTYTQAAQRARQAAGRGPYTGAEPGGALVAEWMDVFAPVLLRAEAETARPETLLLDSTCFVLTNARSGGRSEAFHIFGLYGYPTGQARGRLWGLWAAHAETQHTWQRRRRSSQRSSPQKVRKTFNSDRASPSKINYKTAGQQPVSTSADQGQTPRQRSASTSECNPGTRALNRQLHDGTVWLGVWRQDPSGGRSCGWPAPVHDNSHRGRVLLERAAVASRTAAWSATFAPKYVYLSMETDAVAVGKPVWWAGAVFGWRRH